MISSLQPNKLDFQPHFTIINLSFWARLPCFEQKTKPTSLEAPSVYRHFEIPMKYYSSIIKWATSKTQVSYFSDNVNKTTWFRLNSVKKSADLKRCWLHFWTVLSSFLLVVFILIFGTWKIWFDTFFASVDLFVSFKKKHFL